MKTCINCGQNNPDGAKFCINCGVVLPAVKQKPASAEEAALSGESAEATPAEEAEDSIGAEAPETAQPAGYSDTAPAGNAAPDPVADFNAYYQAQGSCTPQPGIPAGGQPGMQLPEALRPLSTLEYFCYLFLFSIPLIGFICMIVFAAGASQNQNLRNLSRAYLLLVVLASLAAILFFGCGILVSQTIF